MVTKRSRLLKKKQVSDSLAVDPPLLALVGFRNVVTIAQGSPMTMDYRTDRVRVVVNKQQRVAQAPVIA